MDPVRAFLGEVRDIRSTRGGDAENSYYGALQNLFNEIGKSLKPKVRCVISLSNRGAGKPDGGFFTRNQFLKATDPEPKQGQLPERGAIEVKPPGEDVEKTKDAKQVAKYLAEYGLVLVTNLRDYLLVGNDKAGKPLAMERFTLAASEAEFWQAASHPVKTANEKGEQFAEYLKRVMLANAPLTTPQDLAWFLGLYAREARARVENHKDLSALKAVREALEEALGMKFTDDKGEHFFRSTLVQTIFYGVFAAWVRWHRDDPGRTDEFDWHAAGWTLHVPFVQALYHQIATPRQLGPLGLVEVLNWTAGALNRVDREAFFRKFHDEYAVQYFYEPFMEAYDPELRKELGVWYTPPEIVEYQVARVEAVLREELGLEDGLADPNVVVLDPCCGTGAYLVEVLKRIAARLREKGDDALIGADVKKAAMERVFGFEIMPAPFVVSHLQLGLLLQRCGAPLRTASDERAAVYLTNALTGWEPPKEAKKLLTWPELEQERKYAGAVKQKKPVLVVLGNPPYNAFAGTSPDEEQGLVEPFKGRYERLKPRTRRRGKRAKKITYGPDGRPKQEQTVFVYYKLNDPVELGGWGIRKFNLDDLYLRFFRLAERRIAEMTGKGVISFISNFSYLSDPSFVIMRERFLSEFDKLWFDCMNGDSRETGKLTPEGEPDPSVFSTQYNREGIRVGTAVSVIVRKPKRQEKPGVRFRHFWGASKRQDLLESLRAKDFDAAYKDAHPSEENRYSFRPEEVSAAYSNWPKLTELGAEGPYQGLCEDRRKGLISVDRDALASRMRRYFDKAVSWEELRQQDPALTEDYVDFPAAEVRTSALSKTSYQDDMICRYYMRPFDTQFAYYSDLRPLWRRNRPEYFSQLAGRSSFLTARFKGSKAIEGSVMGYVSGLCDYHYLTPNAGAIPLFLREEVRRDGLPGMHSTQAARANLSSAARAYLAALGINAPDANADLGRTVWMHALPIGYSPAYLSENADGIRRDWPRVPLPATREALEQSAALGRQVAALLDTEAEVPGVTSGTIEPFLRTVGVLTAVRGMGVPPMRAAGVSPAGGEAAHGRDGHATHGQDAHATQLGAAAGDLAVTAGWGHAGKGGAVMPGKGRVVERPYDKAERGAIEAAAKARGLTPKQALDLLGENTRDVYLNDKAYWRNIPAAVWDYYIGGYQVIKKWLSYREEGLLGRPLRPEEAREVMNTARRLAALVLLQPALDENYRAVKAQAYEWNEMCSAATVRRVGGATHENP